MKIVTAAEMREIDRVTTEQHSVPSLTLMENAGTAVADFVRDRFPHAERIQVVCGRGNNGGDGFVAARKLQEAGKQVSVLLLADPAELKGDAAAMLSRLPMKALVAKSEADLQKLFSGDADLLVDAILGTGARPPVEGLYAAAIQRINESGAPIVAVDIPSGVNADATRELVEPFVHAAAIVTFTALKPAHVFLFGTVPIAVRQIGTPEEAIVSKSDLNLITPRDFAVLLAPRDPDGHKGKYGHVLVLGGSTGKAGAAAMAGMAALRAGAGLVTVATPKSVLPTVAGFAPELMTEGLAETERGTFSILALESLRKVSESKDVAAIGPGISQDREAGQFVRALMDRSQLPVVLDADGLNAFQEHRQYLNGNNRPLVITPHPGEMSRLTGLSIQEIQSDRIGVARQYAREHNAYVVLKGNHTVVAEPNGRVWINNTGNAGMATGGTGDILTGVVAAMIGQLPNDISNAVIAAVYLHGLAGDVVRDEIGEASLIATDLLLGLPQAFRKAAASLDADIL
jgi:NAD(P)H-hydrate epimerase